MENNNLAPIVLFTYRRVPKETIESLLKNNLANKSELFIFSDGYKSKIDKQDVSEVREYLKTIEGFKKVEIYEAKSNKGLANSIIDGVTKIINRYKKVIVLEDDLIVANDFLEYMNEALEFYDNDKKIWSISGYSPKLECLKDYDKDIYLSVRCNSWGWAIWKDRWDSIDWDIKDWNKFKNGKKFIKEFNLGGNDMFKMLELQMLGKIDSWAIRWCFNQFKQNKYTIYPKWSKIRNIGFNEKGTHNNSSNKKWETLLYHKKLKLYKDIEVNENIIQCFQKYYNLPLKTQIGYFLKKYGGYNFAKNILKKIR